jgi:hypothetical protein
MNAGLTAIARMAAWRSSPAVDAAHQRADAPTPAVPYVDTFVQAVRVIGTSSNSARPSHHGQPLSSTE